MDHLTTSANRRRFLQYAAQASAAAALAPLVGACDVSGREAPAQMQTPLKTAQPAPVVRADPSIGVRLSQDRGLAERSWLKARHSFSFSRYRDPNWKSFGPLRVINEDIIQPRGGFPLHPHNNMEIITYLLEGSLEHKDTLGNGGTIRPGEIQYMSAGSGVRHSEFNAKDGKPAHLLQIWIKPNARNTAPRYESRHFGEERNDELRLLASPHGRDGSISINQDTDLFAAVLRSGQELIHPVAERRRIWLQVARGTLRVNGHHLNAGDAAYSVETLGLEIKALEDAEFLLFDLA